MLSRTLLTLNRFLLNIIIEQQLNLIIPLLRRHFFHLGYFKVQQTAIILIALKPLHLVHWLLKLFPSQLALLDQLGHLRPENALLRLPLDHVGVVLAQILVGVWDGPRYARG